MVTRSRLRKWKKYPTAKQLDEFADAFYDEDYKKISKMLGKKVTNQVQAETELEKIKDRMVR